MSEITIRELMSRMPKALIPENAVGIDTVIQYHLTGAESGDWIVKIKDGQCDIAEGVADAPNMTLTADSADYKDVVTGRSNAMQAFMMGKLKLAGDLTLAMKLPVLFKLG